jgi:hypothetical protein
MHHTVLIMPYALSIRSFAQGCDEFALINKHYGHDRKRFSSDSQTF